MLLKSHVLYFSRAFLLLLYNESTFCVLFSLFYDNSTFHFLFTWTGPGYLWNRLYFSHLCQWEHTDNGRNNAGVILHQVTWYMYWQDDLSAWSDLISNNEGGLGPGKMENGALSSGHSRYDLQSSDGISIHWAENGGNGLEICVRQCRSVLVSRAPSFLSNSSASSLHFFKAMCLCWWIMSTEFWISPSRMESFSGPSRVAAVRFCPVRGQISPNLKPDFGSSSQNILNLNLVLREPDFRSGSGSSRVWTWTRPKGMQRFSQMWWPESQGIYRTVVDAKLQISNVVGGCLRWALRDRHIWLTKAGDNSEIGGKVRISNVVI